MAEQMVITALGADRPGIVDSLSKALFSRQLNIEDSRMSSLGGAFAILLLVTGTKAAIKEFIAERAEIENRLQMQLLIRTSEATRPGEQLVPYLVEVVAMDHPGIVHNLASFFASRGISIVDLETDSYRAAHTGTAMFSLQMTISVPAKTSIKKLREEFLDTCDELNMDASLTSA